MIKEERLNDYLDGYNSQYQFIGKDKKEHTLKEDIKELLEENKQLKDNWNKLKEYIKSEGVSYLNFADERCFCNKKAAKYILNKMQELEGGDNHD